MIKLLEWETVTYSGELLQVIPLFDFRVHWESVRCWCRPKIENEIIVHNAMDNREFFEQTYLQ